MVQDEVPGKISDENHTPRIILVKFLDSKDSSWWLSDRTYSIKYQTRIRLASEFQSTTPDIRRQWKSIHRLPREKVKISSHTRGEHITNIPKFREYITHLTPLKIREVFNEINEPEQRSQDQSDRNSGK